MIRSPQNERSTRTRAAILDAAWNLLETVGPERTTMAAVAEAAGVSRRGLYLHFGNRADLLIGVRGHIDAQYDLASSIRAVFAAPDATTTLREWARHLTEYHSRIRGVVRSVERARQTDQDAAALWDDAMIGWRRVCRQLSERLRTSGDLATGWTVRSASEVLFAYMRAFNAMWESLVMESGWSPARFQEHLATTFRHLLLKSDRSN